MAQDLLATVLQSPSGPVPLYLRAFEIAVDYAGTIDVEDDALDDAVGEVETALKLGFFAWAHFAQREAATLSLDKTANGFVLRGKAEGLHHNVLVALLRLIVNLHHTPLEAHESIRAALGDDADALPPRTIFSETVRSIRISALEGVDQRVSSRQDFDTYLADDEIGLVPSDLFADIGATLEGDRIVAEAKSADAFAQADFEAIEDAFLRLCDSGVFSSLSMIDTLADDAELFIRNGRELVIDDYTCEAYGLLELLNCLTAGNVSVFSSVKSQ